MTEKETTPLQAVERWARREMQAAATPAERELMALVTHRVAGLFGPEPVTAPGRISAADWARIIKEQNKNKI